MTTALYVIWFLVPGFFFLLALWAWLELLSNKQKKDNPADLLRQGLFVLACVFVSIGIDKWILVSAVEATIGDLVPLAFFRILLLPAVLYLTSLALGGTKEIRIGRAPRPSERSQRK